VIAEVAAHEAARDLPRNAEAVEREEHRVRVAEDQLELVRAQGTARFDRVTRLAQRLFGVSVATVTVLDRDTQWFLAHEGFDADAGPRTNSPCNATIAQPDTLVLEDLSADERFAAHPLVAGAPHLRFYAGHPLEAADEPVGTLCLLDERPRTFTPEQREMLSELARWAQDELVRSEELDRAAEVQRSLLPDRAPAVDGYELAATCRAARVVGGDFFDWYPTTDGVGFTVADVMGKGMGAAIIMAATRAALRTTARAAAPAAAVDLAAAALDEDLTQSGTLVTLVHGALDARTHRLRHVDAGHGLTLVVRSDGGWERIGAGGLPLGVLPGQRWEAVETGLDAGDTWLAFSDGVLELLDDPLVGLAGIVDLVSGCRSAQEIVDRVDALCAGTELTDDVTVQVVRRAGRT
jgi:serine phosphatase RsbU (regulator of sigma subunit)